MLDNYQNEEVITFPLSQIKPFENHPFEVRDDESMKETVQSVKEYGVLSPVIVRPHENGGYEMISGHRRMRACELAGIESIPALVREVDRDVAIIMMVDSNVQRENILPSEKAKAYKMKLDAKKRQGKRNDLNAIFLYDDKMVITFNYKEQTKTITFADLEKSGIGSDINAVAAP